MTFGKGVKLGTYEIVELLGAGGMGEVYRARDSKLKRDVAIKVLPNEFSRDADRLSRFQREAEVLASLNHPQIAAIYDLAQFGESRALVLELVEGETLANRITRGSIPVNECLEIAKQIAEALEAAHEKGVTHRDLKPANIKITPRGTIKVLDFGLAKVVPHEGAGSDSDSQAPTRPLKTGAGVILGTVGYMSPEQARVKPMDKRTDIWAFGCLFYEMLAGRSAFGGETISDTIGAILHRDPDWVALPHNVPPSIRRLLQRCLQKDPKLRLHDIADARIEIEEITRLQAMPAEAVLTDSAAVVARPIPASSKTAWILAAAATALFVMSAAAAIVMWSRSAAPASALTRLMITLPSGQAIESGRFQPLALSPDGKLLVYAATIDGGQTKLYLRPLDEIAAQPIAATEGASTPFFSPDGRWLAFYANGALMKVSVAGGAPLTVCKSPPVWSASWGEDDKIVFATTGSSSGLWLVSANGGDAAQITKPKADEAEHGYPQLLSDGQHVLFSVRRDNEWRLALLDTNNNEWRILGNGRIIGEGAQYLPTGHLVYAQSGGLVVTPFDPSDGSLNQPPVPLLERVQTSRFGGTYFAFAPATGTLVYIPAGTTVAERTLLRVDRDGRAATLIEARGAYEYPALSPDGRRIAVTIASLTGSDIWIIDLDRGTRTRLTSGDTSAFPVWGPSSRVAFQSTAPGPWNLFSKALDGTSPQPIFKTTSAGAGATAGLDLLPGTLPTLSGAGPQFPVSWSRDGSTVAFHERKPNGERDIWVVAPGEDPVPFLMTPFDERLPQLSPDNKWLAYVSDEGGKNDVYVQPYPGPGPKSLVSTDGGTDPVWSKDGRELFYRRGDQMMSVAVSTGSEFTASRPQRLFEMHLETGDNGPNYDVSTDGKWFVLPRSDRAPAAAEIHVVLNWFAEIKARSQAANARGSGRASPGFALLPAAFAAGAPQSDLAAVEPGVRDTLQRYSAALEKLDANAVKKVQPSLAAENLARAFREMKELKVAIDEVKVLSADKMTALVSCRVTQTLTPKVGPKQTTAVTRVMRLRRDSDAWVIDGFER
ncbi:MAG: protein kinase [Acidobacteria bacterium]|nr:protein kinase [Acidobacteriota bacterium]